MNSLSLFSYVRGMPLQTKCIVLTVVGHPRRGSRNTGVPKKGTQDAKAAVKQAAALPRRPRHAGLGRKGGCHRRRTLRRRSLSIVSGVPDRLGASPAAGVPTATGAHDIVENMPST